MTFTKFLFANGDENLAGYVERVDVIERIPDAFFNPLCQTLRTQFEVVSRYWSRNNPLFMADQTDRMIGLAFEKNQ